MIIIDKNNSAFSFVVTISEFTTEDEPSYFFLFKHTVTNTATSFTIPFAENQSNFKTRFDKFTINAASLFLNKPTGEYSYLIYENNEDGALLELGLARVTGTSNNEFIENQRVTNFIENGN